MQFLTGKASRTEGPSLPAWKGDLLYEITSLKKNRHITNCLKDVLN